MHEVEMNGRMVCHDPLSMPSSAEFRLGWALAGLVAGLLLHAPSAVAGPLDEVVVVTLTADEICNGVGGSTTATLSWSPSATREAAPLPLTERAPDGSVNALGNLFPPKTLTRAAAGAWDYSIFLRVDYPEGGSVTYQSAPPLAVQVPAAGAAACAPPQDVDGDLLPDAWELAWGLNPGDATDADLDADGDRLTSRDEFHAGTDPTVFTDATTMSDRQLLDLFKGKAVVYFWEQSRPPYYYTPDNAHYDNPAIFSNGFNSIATTGFAIMSYVVADDRGWIGHEDAYERIRTLLARAVALQDPAYDVLGVPSTQQGNRHGLLYHFVDNQGFRHPDPNVEISTIDHALFVAGALVAAEYYRGTEVESLAQQLFLNTDWNWLYDGTFIIQGWVEDPSGPLEGGRPLDLWDRYSELLVLLTLAMGHPDGANVVPASAWDNLTYGQGRMFPLEYAHLFPGGAPESFPFVPNMPNTIEEPGFTNSGGELHYLHAGSLHNHQYSHMFLDFRERRDRYATDFFANSISATMANRQFAVNLNAHAFPDGSGEPQPYETYGPDSWGLMAGLSSFGYAVLQPIVMAWENFSPENIASNNDSGTVVLSAALGSTPFTSRQTVDLVRNYLARFQAQESGYDALVGRYGFRNAFNLGRTWTGQIGHFPSEVIGLDLGPNAGNVENFQSGLVWKFAMRNAYVQQGLSAAGFPTGVVEPFVLNFDDNPPAPHEDPNGGGVDPNSFGGSSFAFGTGTIAYVDIGDPLPGVNFGPQQWAQRITTATNNDDGAFILLKNHSVSHWDRLSLWIRGEVGGEAYSVGLKDRVMDRIGEPLQATEVKLPIANYHPNGVITSTWTEVRLPLRDFADQGVRLTELDNLSFTNLNPAGGTIYVDDIAFLGDEFSPAAPEGVSASSDGVAVSVSWLANGEPDVVGYRLYRRPSGAGVFTQVNALLVVSPEFTDDVLTHGYYDYYVTAVDNAQPANEGPASEVVMVAHGVLPDAPTNLVSYPQHMSMINVAWDAVVDVTQYRVERSLQPAAGFVEVGVVAASANATVVFTDGQGSLPPLAENTTYYYRVRAENASGLHSDYSAVHAARTDRILIAEPTDDTWVDVDDPTATHGGEPTLVVSGHRVVSGSGKFGPIYKNFYDQRSYLKFNIGAYPADFPGEHAARVSVELICDDSDGVCGSVYVWGGTTEETLATGEVWHDTAPPEMTFANQPGDNNYVLVTLPAVAAGALASAYKYRPNPPTSFDIWLANTSGYVTLVLKGYRDGENDAAYAARQQPGQAPKLILQLRQPSQ